MVQCGSIILIGKLVQRSLSVTLRDSPCSFLVLLFLWDIPDMSEKELRNNLDTVTPGSFCRHLAIHGHHTKAGASGPARIRPEAYTDQTWRKSQGQTAANTAPRTWWVEFTDICQRIVHKCAKYGAEMISGTQKYGWSESYVAWPVNQAIRQWRVLNLPKMGRILRLMALRTQGGHFGPSSETETPVIA